MEIQEKRIVEAVDRLSDEILDFTCRLVAEPSTLRHEASAVQVMEKELLGLSLEPVRVPVVPETLIGHPGFAPVPWSYEGRENVVAVRAADGSGGKSAVFNGHIDVVSPEPAVFWSRDPFKPVVDNGWIYGRGAADMKGGVAAMTYAVHAIAQAGFGLRAPVTIQGVIEEECTGNGTLACIQAGYSAEAALIPEPLGPTILTDQLGVLWFKVSLSGVPVHVHEAQAGTNAIEKSIPMFAALRKLEADMNRGERHPGFQNNPHPINLNIGVFKGGDWPSTVPAQAEFHCRLSFFPSVSYENVCRVITQTIAAAAAQDPWLGKNPPQVEFYGFRSEGISVSRQQPALMTLNGCHRDIYGQDAESLSLTATTDIRAFAHFTSAQTTCYGPTGQNLHGTDERVNMASIIQCAKVYALFLARWCGLTE